MQIDCCYQIGHSHQVCQDYAICGHINKNISYAILSDGCSSSNHVDVGARILCHVAKEYLYDRYKTRDKIDPNAGVIERLLRDYIIAASTIIIGFMHLRLDSLNATLSIILSDGETTHVFMYGDGTLIVKKHNGVCFMNSVEFECGAPYYMIYDGDQELLKRYKDQYGDTPVNIICTGTALPSDLSKFNSEITMSLKEFNYDKQVSVFTYDDVKEVHVTSDGIGSYLDIDVDTIPAPSKASVNVDPSVIANELLAIKNYNGTFIQRRMARMKRDFGKINRTHFDDMSVASLIVGD